jgi:chitinase
MKFSYLFFAALFFLNACSPGTPKSKDVSPSIVLAYVTSRGPNLPDPNHITHINYAFGRVHPDFNGVTINNEDRLMQVTGLKAQKPSLKVLLSIGGWGAGRFSEMAADPNLRLAFAADCKRVVDQFNLDGIDMDWEYPSSSESGISSSPEDIGNFTLLMRDIRTAIGKDKLLTFASAANAEYVDFEAVNPYIDFVNIMTYDIAHPPYHQAGLYRSEHTKDFSCEESVNAHVAKGIPIHKLTLGIPFYGHGCCGIARDVIYKDIVTNPEFDVYTKMWDDVAKAPYFVNSEGQFVLTYDDARSIAEKCRFIHEKGMLGAMYWQYDQDDENSTLRQAVYNGIFNK